MSTYDPSVKPSVMSYMREACHPANEPLAADPDTHKEVSSVTAYMRDSTVPTNIKKEQ